MGDRLWTSKPFRYVTSQLGQLSLSSLRGWSSTNLPGWGEGGHLCRVAVWQITLCDLIDKWRPVVLRWISRRTIRSFTFTFTISPCYGRRHAVSMYRIRKRGKVSSLIMTSPEAAPYDRHCIIVHDGWSGQLRARTLHTWPCTCLSSVVRCIYYTRPRHSITRCTNFSELFSSLLSAQQPPIS